MHRILSIVHIVVAVLLIASILLQQRSGGLSPVFGQEAGFYRTRRGIEQFIFWATIVLSFLFIAIAVVTIAAR